MCSRARIPLSRSANTFGKLVPRPSPLTFILSQGPTTRKQRKLRALALSYLGTLAPFSPLPSIFSISSSITLPLFHRLVLPPPVSTRPSIPSRPKSPKALSLLPLRFHDAPLSLTFYLLIDESRVNPFG